MKIVMACALELSSKVMVIFYPPYNYPPYKNMGSNEKGMEKTAVYHGLVFPSTCDKFSPPLISLENP